MKFSNHDRLSAEIAAWCFKWLPDHTFATCIAHGARHPGMAMRLKRLGTESGVPDWLIVYEGRVLFIELKTGKADLSTEQRKTRGRLHASGAVVEIAHSIGEFIDIIARRRIPLLHQPRRDPMDDGVPEF